MLKFLRTGGASLGVWIILGILAVAFGLSFGLPSDSISVSGGSGTYAKVYGDDIRDGDFQYQAAVASTIFRVPEDPRQQMIMRARESIFDGILEREIMADAGREMGLETDAHDAELLTRDGTMIAYGFSIDWLGTTPFNYQNLFKGSWLPRFGTTERAYLDFQKDEVLARTVRDVIAASTVVPESRLREVYEAQAERIDLRYVRFDGLAFSELVDPSDEEIADYVQAHSEELDQKRTSQGERFTKLPAQVRLRFLKANRPAALPEGAVAAAEAEWKKQDAAAKARVADAQRRIAAGEDFRRVARELSQDESTARGGGDYGWVSLEGTGSGLEPAVDEAAKALDVGGVSPLVVGEEGYYLVQIAGKREGDVSAEDAMRELAEEAVKRERGKVLAKQAAQEALLNLKGGKTMAELFPPAGAQGPGVTAMETTGPFPRGPQIPGLGIAPELSNAAWAADAKTEALEQVFELPTGYVIAGIESRKEASDEEFAEQREMIADALTREKALRVTAHFAKRRCTDAVGQGELVGNDAQIKRLMTYDADAQAEFPDLRPYTLCDLVGNRGGVFNATRGLGR